LPSYIFCRNEILEKAPGTSKSRNLFPPPDKMEEEAQEGNYRNDIGRNRP